MCDCVKKTCDCPASFGTRAAGESVMPLGEQLDRILSGIECEDNRAHFLAGVRFVQGFRDYGDSLMRMSDAELDRALMEEFADQIVYGAEIQARAVGKLRKGLDSLKKVYASDARLVQIQGDEGTC